MTLLSITPSFINDPNERLHKNLDKVLQINILITKIKNVITKQIHNLMHSSIKYNKHYQIILSTIINNK